jgi:hypothetical protein
MALPLAYTGSLGEFERYLASRGRSRGGCFPVSEGPRFVLLLCRREIASRRKPVAQM